MMATKATEQLQPDSVWNKAGDDEPLFILRATDVLAVPLINIWISQASLLETFGKRHNIKTIPDSKVNSAIDIRNQMLNWQAANPDRMKLPD